jgi:chromosome segregation ATPase
MDETIKLKAEINRLTNENNRLNARLNSPSPNESKLNQEIMKLRQEINKLRSTQMNPGLIQNEINKVKMEHVQQIAQLRQELMRANSNKDCPTQPINMLDKQCHMKVNEQKSFMNSMVVEKSNMYKSYDDLRTSCNMDIVSGKNQIDSQKSEIQRLNKEIQEFRKSVQELKQLSGYSYEKGQEAAFINSLRYGINKI